MSDRCGWVGDDALYQRYHDEEWGVPVTDARALWEALMLEGFQAGLSWITILRKREAFRAAFAGFDPHIIAKWGQSEVERLLQNPGIVRHRGKIEGAIASARAFQEIEAAQGFTNYIWSFVDNRPLQPKPARLEDVPAQTELSKAMSKDLKGRGFKFCGPTITYAFMQAVGLVNDHLVTCPRHDPVASFAMNLHKGFG
ncbi:MAG: DNA-3-methyladenine glycosylase I [Pseudomonadota bacterium]